MGCESRGKTSLDHNLGDLSKVDRVVVSRAGVTPIATITDATKVKAVIAFVERYRTDWRSAWAGAGSERVVTFYAGPEGVKSFGVGPRGINDGTYVRELSDAELREACHPSRC